MTEVLVTIQVGTESKGFKILSDDVKTLSKETFEKAICELSRRVWYDVLHPEEWPIFDVQRNNSNTENNQS